MTRRLNRTVKATVLDDKGNISHAEFVKSRLCAGIRPIDVRHIDSRLPNVVPRILIRQNAILFNALHISALIQHDRVLLFESASAFPSSSLALHSAFLHNLSTNLRNDRERKTDGADEGHTDEISLPYEFRALEAMLNSSVAALESELAILKTLVLDVLEGLERHIERGKLKDLLQYTRRLGSFTRRSQLLQESLEEVLDQEDDMARAYLTASAQGQPHLVDDHEQLEQLLESYAKNVEQITTEAQGLLSNVKASDQLLNLILDSNRNELLALDLKVSVATAGLGGGALIASLFGMNLQSGMEQTPGAFGAMASLAGFAVVAVTAIGLRRLHKIRRVGLRGHDREAPIAMSWW